MTSIYFFASTPMKNNVSEKNILMTVNNIQIQTTIGFFVSFATMMILLKFEMKQITLKVARE